VKPIDRFIDVDIRMHVREWMPINVNHHYPSIVLLHGLASNAKTWDLVADQLADAGFQAISVDLRGHGLSDKPDDGYDFFTITSDLDRLFDALELSNIVLAGQSWGGNVLLEFAARFPGRAEQYIFVDGGFLSLANRGSWEEVAVELRPPDLIGIPRVLLSEKIKAMHPGWGDVAIEATLGNFEILPDDTVRPQLTLERHIAILKAMYEQNVHQLFSQVKESVLICAADDDSEWAKQKRIQIEKAHSMIDQVEVLWFKNAAHDIHVDRPRELARAILDIVNRQIRK
jgi:pimeloyl-ACP methyl ester carboxylesterase